MARVGNGDAVILVPTDEQRELWAKAAYEGGAPLPSFAAWAVNYMARYTVEVRTQGIQRKEDPILLRLDEKKLLRAVVDAAWHALDFLPPPMPHPIKGGIKDPKRDLRKALEALHDFLLEHQEEYRK